MAAGKESGFFSPDEAIDGDFRLRLRVGALVDVKLPVVVAVVNYFNPVPSP